MYTKEDVGNPPGKTLTDAERQAIADEWNANDAASPSYIDKRRPLYREKLATLKGEPGMDEVGVIGFQLDAIFTQIVTLAGGVGNLTPEMQAIIAKVQEVKTAVPKN